jgi:hypothetical protein
MQRDPIEEIEKEESELTAEIKALEAECHVDRLRSGQGAFVPYVFGTGAVALVVSTIVNFFSNAIWIEIFPLISAFMDLWMMIAFYGAMKSLQKPISGLIITYIALMVTRLPGLIYICLPNQTDMGLYLMFYSIYVSMFATSVIAFIISERLISNYYGRLARIGWIFLVSASVILILLFVFVIMPMIFNISDNLVLLYNGIIFALMNAVDIYLNYEMMQLMRDRER